MPMMTIREMRMGVTQRCMRVGMVVGFPVFPWKVVVVLMVFIMSVRMGMG
jgi:hypothetical protein